MFRTHKNYDILGQITSVFMFNFSLETYFLTLAVNNFRNNF